MAPRRIRLAAQPLTRLAASVEPLNLRSRIVSAEDFPVLLAGAGAPDRAPLAQPDAVSRPAPAATSRLTRPSPSCVTTSWKAVLWSSWSASGRNTPRTSGPAIGTSPRADTIRGSPTLPDFVVRDAAPAVLGCNPPSLTPIP